MKVTAGDRARLSSDDFITCLPEHEGIGEMKLLSWFLRPEGNSAQHCLLNQHFLRFAFIYDFDLILKIVLVDQTSAFGGGVVLTYACGGQRSMPNVFLSFLPPLHMEAGSVI